MKKLRIEKVYQKKDDRIEYQIYLDNEFIGNYRWKWDALRHAKRIIKYELQGFKRIFEAEVK